MNFEAFLPNDIKDALNRELEILKETAIKGSMDTLKETNEDEEWEMAAAVSSDDGSDKSSGKGSWSDTSDTSAANEISSPSSSAPVKFESSSSSSYESAKQQQQQQQSVPGKLNTQSRKLPPFMATLSTNKGKQDELSQNKKNDNPNNDIQVKTETNKNQKPMSAAAAALLAVENAASENKMNTLSNKEENNDISFAEARKQVLNRMSEETVFQTNSNFLAPSLTQQQQSSSLCNSPIPVSASNNFFEEENSFDSIDRAVISPQQTPSHPPNHELSFNTPPISPANPPPNSEYSTRLSNSLNGQLNSNHLKNPNYEMHSQVEAFLSGNDQILPRTSLVETAANKINQNTSYFSENQHKHQKQFQLERISDRSSNPYLRGIDPLHPSNLSTLSNNNQQHSILPPMHLGRPYHGEDDYNEDHDPILASIHNRNYLSELEHKQHHSLPNTSSSSYFNNDREHSDHFNYTRGGGGGGIVNNSLNKENEEDWLSEQQFMRSVNASTYDPFKQLLLSHNTGGGDGGGGSILSQFSSMLTTQRLSAWIEFWEEWKYTFYVVAPGIALMVLYFKFSYAEEIN